MAEIKEVPISQSQLTQQFIEFVMMQAQQTSLFLGKIPHPATGKIMQNLEAARLFIDQLEMLREKTRGNLSSEESEILNHILSDLRFAYVEAAASQKKEKAEEPQPQMQTEENVNVAEKEVDSEAKKKFSKNYGM
jgi:Domain of unknown function (DUF1844)